MLPYTFQRVMMAELRQAGYDDAKAFPGKYIQPVPELPITITDTRVSVPKDLGMMPGFSKLVRGLNTHLGIANEATWLFDNTPDSRSKVLGGQKLFVSYMNTLLTARMTENGEPQYSVQTKEYDGSLTINKRTGSYMDAKLHFLVMSPIHKNIEAFSHKYMAQIYDALIFRGQHDTEMKPLENEILRNAISAIEQAFPGFAPNQRQPEPETGLEVEP